jgi:hypothetical protein
MADVLSIQTVKTLTYRDTAAEPFTNRYYFKSAPPSPTDSTTWDTYFQAVWNHEKLIFPASVHLIEAHGYNSDDEDAHRTYSKLYNLSSSGLPGEFAAGTGTLMAGDQAAVVEWKTDVKGKSGKWIYLRKYFHHGYANGANPDELDSVYAAALQKFANDMAFTSVLGGLRSRTHNLNVAQALVYPWVTTRTLKHRGKRGGPKA